MKTSESTIQFRIDTKTKDEARKTLEELGVDLSTAMKMFLRNVIITQSLPLDLRTENGFARAAELEMIREVQEAKRIGKRYATTKDLMRDLDA